MQRTVVEAQLSGLDAGDLAGIVAAVLAAVGLAGSARSLFLRTLGRRWDLARRMRRLGTGAQLGFFEAILGEPPAIRRTFRQREDRPDEHGLAWISVDRTYTECFWVDPLYYVQTVSDEDGAVVAFTITTRSRDFRPTFTFPVPPTRRELLAYRLTRGRLRPSIPTVQLGRSTFADVAPPDLVPKIFSWMGVRNFGYAESWYLGNPGHYQELVVGMSNVAHGGEFGALETLEWDDTLGDFATAPEWVRQTHHHAAVMIFGVVAAHRHPGLLPTVGPDGDAVRTIP